MPVLEIEIYQPPLPETNPQGAGIPPERHPPTATGIEDRNPYHQPGVWQDLVLKNTPYRDVN